MFPFIRLIYQFFRHRNDAPLGPLDTHVSHHICWPWDLDLWRELNNGRTLTIYDLGRLPLAGRVGLIKVLKANGWGLTMAGASVRYRRRVRMFDRIEMRSRAVCWDDKFLYLEQSMRVRGEATSHVLYRSAVTGKNGIVPPQQVMGALELSMDTPETPAWIKAWIEAESTRPWPPF
ncbi:acyl-CoA thioesterase [Litoreibacter albidus]|uniref:Acyl-CoA thioesterase FadM n=1 Tax=Litoreibacter albidus TaxID=670155 RepID=A0A1H2VXP5_9RHOB|nr:acyl-CoA thioesterase [Litoreibacter albidus]SDW73172.1 Acyl-CoA thioesterase FadM [Litoreibacter albidus]